MGRVSIGLNGMEDKDEAGRVTTTPVSPSAGAVETTALLALHVLAAARPERLLLASTSITFLGRVSRYTMCLRRDNAFSTSIKGSSRQTGYSLHLLEGHNRSTNNSIAATIV